MGSEEQRARLPKYQEAACHLLWKHGLLNEVVNTRKVKVISEVYTIVVPNALPLRSKGY